MFQSIQLTYGKLPQGIKVTIYFCLVLAIWLIQVALTYQTLPFYRFEDGGQNATAVYWFANREVAIITSTFFGWYALLHSVYSIFGFSIDIAHYVRLAVHAVSLLSLAYLLKKYLGYGRAIVPLVTLGLSPTLTHFVTYSSQYGFELQLLPICLVLIDFLNFERKCLAITIETALWFLAMFGLLTFSTFTFFLPALGILYLAKLQPLIKKREWVFVITHCLISSAAFLAPLAAGLLYFANPQQLFYSPGTDSGGLFRSGSKLVFDMNVFWPGIVGTFKDLFLDGYSYYYQAKNGEFSYILPGVTFFFVLTLGILWPIRLKHHRLLLLIIWTTILANLLIANFGVDLSGLPGIRRNTAALAGFLALYVLIWKRVTTKQINYTAIVILLLLPLHHLLVLPDNYSHLSSPGHFLNDKRFATSGTPQKYFEEKLSILTREDLYLDCREAYNLETEGCSYQNIFSTLAASCMYNKLPCHAIHAYDPLLDKFIPLNIESLEDHWLF